MTLEELASVTGINNQKDLKEQLGELFFLGATPHVADLIQVDYDSETDTFGLILPFRFDSSLRLSIREWLTLRKILEEVVEASSDPKTNSTARKILQKIISIVPIAGQEALSVYKTNIQNAIQNEKSLILEYQSRMGEKSTLRKVDPWFLFHSLEDYLLGYCHERKAPRNFRLDNILSLKIGSDPILQPAGQKNQIIFENLKNFVKVGRIHPESQKFGILGKCFIISIVNSIWKEPKKLKNWIMSFIIYPKPKFGKKTGFWKQFFHLEKM